MTTGLFLGPYSERLDEQAMDRALSVAQATAADPELPTLLRAREGPSADGPVQTIAERVRRSTGASYVVVLDRRGIRWSHTEPHRVGERVSTDPAEALAGREVRHIDAGTLGRSARGKVPVRDAAGQVVGAVSVGMAYDDVRERLLASLPELLAYAGGALGAGALAALLVSRKLRRKTHGLAFSDLSALLAERSAMLHGIHEGIVALDARGRIRLVNDEAQRLLELGPEAQGLTADEALGPGRTTDVLTGRATGRDLLTVSGGRVLLANRMPTDDGGAVATFRDRTELELLGRELDGSHGLIDALRAQEHEHANRVHLLLGLLQLGLYDEAVDYLSETAGRRRDTTREISERVREPLLAALLVGKATVAAERGVAFRLTPGTRVPDRLVDPRELATVVGNLVDNALDAAAGTENATVEVELAVREDGRTTRAAPAPGLLIRVRDSGRGIPPEQYELIFTEGWSTKEPPAHGWRGLGLALVRRLAERHGGTATVCEPTGGGAEFTVTIPEALRPEPGHGPGPSPARGTAGAERP
ncbi:sensor histidine kinase [Streptomyces sp. AJS327]|uniref:ATP-binding protein n=1 Tax=Streptomyces sp. AJS327 TaxID=2545265 RepID=UPI0015DF3759|nr:sensor histidine kinase [Streptomyces sp. AJS327]MBA0051984.1 sensor histidine kinase [Streptomyces sp. AJS327]